MDQKLTSDFGGHHRQRSRQAGGDYYTAAHDRHIDEPMHVSPGNRGNQGRRQHDSHLLKNAGQSILSRGGNRNTEDYRRRNNEMLD